MDATHECQKQTNTNAHLAVHLKEDVIHDHHCIFFMPTNYFWWTVHSFIVYCMLSWNKTYFLVKADTWILNGNFTTHPAQVQRKLQEGRQSAVHMSVIVSPSNSRNDPLCDELIWMDVPGPSGRSEWTYQAITIDRISHQQWNQKDWWRNRQT